MVTPQTSLLRLQTGTLHLDGTHVMVSRFAPAGRISRACSLTGDLAQPRGGARLQLRRAVLHPSSIYLCSNSSFHNILMLPRTCCHSSTAAPICTKRRPDSFVSRRQTIRMSKPPTRCFEQRARLSCPLLYVGFGFRCRHSRIGRNGG